MLCRKYFSNCTIEIYYNHSLYYVSCNDNCIYNRRCVSTTGQVFYSLEGTLLNSWEKKNTKALWNGVSESHTLRSWLIPT